jgi:hypothetical protein
VRLIMDLADEGALFAARFHGKPLDCGRNASSDAPPTTILYLVGST